MQPDLRLPYQFKTPKHPKFEHTFNGNKERFIGWFEALQQWMTSVQPRREWVIYLLGSTMLKGDALSQWRAALPQFATCEAAITWLYDTFASRVSVVHLKENLLKFKMQPDEKPESYLLRFQRTTRRLEWAHGAASRHRSYDTIRDRMFGQLELQEIFEKGMKPGLLRKYMENDRPRNLIQAMARVHEVADQWERQDTYGRRAQAKTQRQKQAYAAQTSENKPKPKADKKKKKQKKKQSQKPKAKPSADGDKATPAQGDANAANRFDRRKGGGQRGQRRRPDNRPGNRPDNRPKKGDGDKRACFCCGEKDHMVKDCPILKTAKAYQDKRQQNRRRPNSGGGQRKQTNYVAASSVLPETLVPPELISPGLATLCGMAYGGLAPDSAPVVYKDVDMAGIGTRRGMYDTGCSYNFLNDEVKEDLGDKLAWEKMSHPLRIDTAGNDGCQKEKKPTEPVKLRFRCGIDVMHPTRGEAFTHKFWHLPGKFSFIFGRGMGKFHGWGPFESDDYEVIGEPDIPTSELEVDGDVFHMSAHPNGSLFYDGS